MRRRACLSVISVTKHQLSLSSVTKGLFSFPPLCFINDLGVPTAHLVDTCLSLLHLLFSLPLSTSPFLQAGLVLIPLSSTWPRPPTRRGTGGGPQAESKCACVCYPTSRRQKPKWHLSFGGNNKKVFQIHLLLFSDGSLSMIIKYFKLMITFFFTHCDTSATLTSSLNCCSQAI